MINNPIDIEIRFIEQEHRILHVIHNICRYGTKNGDPRRWPSIVALVWLLFGRIIPIGGIGVASMLSLFIALSGNDILSQQNELIKTQNVLIDSQRQAAIYTEIANVMDQVYIEFKEWVNLSAHEKSTQWLIRANIDVSNQNCQVKEEPKTCAYGFPITVATLARIVALTYSIRPYKYLDSKTGGTTFRLLSPERGHILTMLINSGVFLRDIALKGDFSYSDLGGARINGANLAGAMLDYANLGQSIVAHSIMDDSTQLYQTVFDDATVCDSTFIDVVLSHTSFAGTRFAGGAFSASVIEESTFESATIFDMHVNEKLYEHIKSINNRITKKLLGATDILITDSVTPNSILALSDCNYMNYFRPPL